MTETFELHVERLREMDGESLDEGLTVEGLWQDPEPVDRVANWVDDAVRAGVITCPAGLDLHVVEMSDDNELAYSVLVGSADCRFFYRLSTTISSFRDLTWGSVGEDDDQGEGDLLEHVLRAVVRQANELVAPAARLWGEPSSEEILCEECGADVSQDSGVVSDSHSTACSCHPGNVVAADRAGAGPSSPAEDRFFLKGSSEELLGAVLEDAHYWVDETLAALSDGDEATVVTGWLQDLKAPLLEAPAGLEFDAFGDDRGEGYVLSVGVRTLAVSDGWRPIRELVDGDIYSRPLGEVVPEVLAKLVEQLNALVPHARQLWPLEPSGAPGLVSS